MIVPQSEDSGMLRISGVIVNRRDGQLGPLTDNDDDGGEAAPRRGNIFIHFLALLSIPT